MSAAFSRPDNAVIAAAVFFRDPLRYAEGVRIQERLVALRQADAIPDTVLFLEHTPVVTLGRRGRTTYLLLPADELRARGIDVERASRGGDVTYHGPGQLVIYPILKLDPRVGSRSYLWQLEEIAIRTAASFGIAAYRRAGMNGAWTDAGKIAAIGFHLRRWVAMHGMSFNVNLDLSGFSHIVGCGLVGERVSSLGELLGVRCPDAAQVRERMAEHFAAVCGRRWVEPSAHPALPDLLRSIAPDGRAAFFRPPGAPAN